MDESIQNWSDEQLDALADRVAERMDRGGVTRRGVLGLLGTAAGVGALSGSATADPNSANAAGSAGTENKPFDDVWAVNGHFDVTNTERTYLTDHGVAPRQQDQAERRPGYLGLSVQSKTELISTVDLSWTSQDIFWGVLVHAQELFNEPLGKYYLYFSEDHSDGAIGLAYGDDLQQPFTDYGQPVMDFHTGQDETPHPVWDPVNQRLNVYYHTGDVGRNQTTSLATSTDGINFSDQGAVIDVDGDVPGDGHTGYARVHRIGDSWIAHHLLGGGDSPRFGVSYSNDGVDWDTDTTPINGSLAQFGDTRRFDWFPSLLPVGGQMFAIGARKDWVSGIDTGGARAVIAPLADERTLAGEPVELIEPTESWEGTGVDVPATFVDAGRLHVTYTSDDSIGVADMGVVL